MPTSDPDALLADLWRCCATGEPLTLEVRAWFAHALQALADGEQDALEDALGLVRAGGGQTARLARRLRLAARDAHLRAALDAVADRDVPAWERCQRLAEEVRRFERNRPGAMPPALPLVRRNLWHAARIGLPLPSSARGLWRALNAITPCSRQ